MKTLISRFRSSSRGNFAVTMALALLPVMLAAGAAVDYSRMSSAHSQVQEAVDTAVLAAAAFEGSDDQRIAHGIDVFEANMATDFAGFKPAIKITISPEGLVAGSAHGDLESTFLGIAGIMQTGINGYAEVRTGGSMDKAEIVFVLDYSSSMTGQYEAMRDAAISLINKITANGSNKNIRIGLVPFSREVYASLDGRYVHGGTAGETWSNCTIGRQWPFVVSDSTPTGAAASKWGLIGDDDHADVQDPHYYSGCSGYPSRGLVVRPLTSDHAGTIAQLRAMRPYAGTNMAAGLEFGWQVISPQSPWTEGVSYSNTEWTKTLILLGDGRHNRPGFGPGGRYSADQGRENMASVCSGMKKKGIRIITVAYELDDADGKAEMRECASEAQYFLEGNETNISSVFENVGFLLAGKDIYLSK